MKLNMAVIDRRETELSEAERLAEAKAFVNANRQAIVDAAIKNILGSMAVAEVKPMKIEWGTPEYNALSYEQKRKHVDGFEETKHLGTFI